MLNTKLNSKGFTLIELLVVIAIIGVLVTIVVIAINPVKLLNDARDGRARSNMLAIKAGLQLYYNDCRNYPTALPAADTQWDGADDDVPTVTACSPTTTVYMRQVPSITGINYQRVSASEYRITANLSTTQSTRSADDTSTLNKCGAATTDDAIDYAVCND